MKAARVSLAVFACVLCGCATLPQTARTDHHMHLRSAQMGQLLGSLCGALAECDPAVVATEIGAGEALAELDGAGFEKGLILSLGYMPGLAELKLPFDDVKRLTRDENEFVAGQVARYPDRLVGFFGINPLAENALDEIEYWAERRELKGVKLHFANSNVDLRNSDHLAALKLIFASLEDHNLSAYIHLRNRRLDYGARDVELFISEVLANVPELYVTIAHMGGWGGYDENSQAAMDAFIAALTTGELDRQRISFGVAAVIIGQTTDVQKAKLVDDIRAVGVDSVIFGSDWDSRSFGQFGPKETVQNLRKAGLTDRELDQILGNNAPYMR